MSEADAQEGTPITAEGITVEKTYEFDEFPVPAVMFVIRSDRDDPATIRLTDPLPDGVSTDDVGLHPNYGEESLSIESDHVALERELDPGEEFTAVYGLREVEKENLASAPTTPENVEVSPALEEVESSSQVVRDVIEGAGEEDEDEDVEPLELREPDEDAAADAGAEAETDPDPEVELDLDEESHGDDADLDPAITRADDEDERPSPVAAGTEGVAAALANEIRSGRVDDEDLELLREELEFGTGSDEARMQRLQTEVSDLQAYTDALEEFLDENGTAQQLLSELQSRVGQVESELGRTTDRVEAHDETLDAVGEQVETATGLAERLEGDVAALESEVDERVESVETTVGDVDERVESVETTVDDVAEQVESVDEELAGVVDDLDELRTELGDLEEELGDVDAVGDRIEELEETVEEMSEDLEEVSDIQQRLQSVFGGGSDDDEE